MAGKHEADVPVEWLRENFELRAGSVYWRTPNGHVRNLALPAGYLAPHGYRMVKAHCGGKRRTFYAHRIAFALARGHWPEGHIDHIDGDRDNNAPANLRDGDYLTNNRNKRLGRRNTTGVSGVWFDKSAGKWKATIGKSTQLGRFTEKERAVAARRAAEAALGYHTNHGRS